MQKTITKTLLLAALLICYVTNISAAVYTGSCGNSATYSLNTETGLLEIKGSGSMIYPYAPWYSYSSSVKEVKISDKITSIGSGAFSSCYGLTSVTIGNSVTSIGSLAFESCYSLTSVTIPNSVTSIGSSAFESCSGLTSVTIPNSVTSIGSGAFSSCYGLTSITIPNSVTSISNYAFSDCSGLTSITIPNSVTSIGDNAFKGCSGLTSVTIPNSVTSIGSGAFFGCYRLYEIYNLSNINIVKGSSDYGGVAFYAQIVHNSLDEPSAYKQAGDFLFIDSETPKLVSYTGKATNITLPNDFNGSNYSIGYSAFRGCSSLTSVTIPNSVTSIGDYAFCNCSGLTSITIPNCVTSIGSGAFYNCSGLTSVTIPNSVTSIGSSAFYDCSCLTSVIIGNSVTSIGSSAFYDCSGLTSVTIGNSVTSIGSYAFNGCYKLCEVYNLSKLNIVKGSSDYGSVAYYAQIVHNSLDEPSAYKQAGDFLFIDSETPTLVSYTGKETNITLPNDFNGRNYSIGSGAFYRCYSLTSVTIPNSVTSIGDDAFSGCFGLTSVTIPNSVTSIGSGAFYRCYSLTSVTIPNSVTSISNYAFSDCSGLTSITIPNSVTSIGSYAFRDCSGLTSVTIPNSVTSIGNYAFQSCSGLTSVTIPNSVTSIGSSAFYGCSGLTSVTIPNSVTSIGSDAFRYCYKLCEVYNLSNLNIVKGSFNNGYVAYYAQIVHNSLDEPSAYKQVGDFLFIDSETPTLVSYTGKSTNITLPNDFNGRNYSIGSGAFYRCSGLTSVTIPNSVTSIGDYAFRDCSGLTSVTIGNSVTSIGDYAFNGCYKLCEVYNLSKLNIVKGSSDYGSVAYYAQIVHNSLDEPSIYKQVGDFLFLDSKTPTLVSYTGKSTNITLPNDFNGRNYSIGSYAFRDCSGLTSVTIGNSVTSIGDYAFSGCSGIKDIINLSSTPQSSTGSLPTTATVHVLYGCKSAYKASSAWRNYNIVEEDAETLFSLKSVSFEKEKMYVNVGAEFKLTPVINPSFIPASNYDIIWKTSNSSVLSYDQATQQFIAKQEGVVTVSVRVIDSNDKIVSAQMTVYVGESYRPICAAPVITYTDGEIKCVSETESATCHYEYEITTPSGSGENCGKLSPKLIVKAYATAEEHRDSETVTETFDLNGGSGLKGDMNGDGVVNMQDANIIVNKYLGK